MRKNLITIIVSLVLVVITVIAWKVISEKIAHDRKYTYFGRKLNESEYQELKKKNDEANERFPETVRRLNAGWDLIGIGNQHFIAGRYTEAAEAYEKAREIDPGNYVVDGHVIEAYEKLGRYDEAIAIVDQILNKNLAEVGVKHYTDLRNRLIAAKTSQ